MSIAARWLNVLAPPRSRSSLNDRCLSGGVLASITLILRSRYLLGLVLFMLLHTSAATLLQFEQGRIVADSYSDVASRTQFSPWSI